MVVSLAAAALLGVDAYRVEVEVDVAGGLPHYQVVGLPDAAVKEGGSRIRAALRNCGHDLPARKITVNLAPADRRKDGASFDLAIALGVVVGGGILPDAGRAAELLKDLLVLGELGLEGTVRPVRGALAVATLAADLGLRGVLLPRACAREAAAVGGIEVFAIEHLAEVLRALEGLEALPRWRGEPALASGATRDPGDFGEVRGQERARLAVEIAVAGGHNVLLYGPPGVGKTMIASRIPTILPPMTHAEAIEVTKIYSAAGLSPPEGLVLRRPFRAPHHTCSAAALVGGGAIPRPGEVSLAHRGVLFLDELPEFSRLAVESLRQPIEDRVVRIGRVRMSVRLPASFLLAASANPCPCGWHGSDERACTCSMTAIERYRGRLSGPLLDRIDLQVRVPGVSLLQMRATGESESSAAMRARVEAARARQAARLAPWRVRTNAEMPPAALRATCRLTSDAERTLANLFARGIGVTARGIDRIVRVARTVCDLDGRDRIEARDVTEAATHRALDLDPIFDPRRALPRLAWAGAGARPTAPAAPACGAAAPACGAAASGHEAGTRDPGGAVAGPPSPSGAPDTPGTVGGGDRVAAGPRSGHAACS